MDQSNETKHIHPNALMVITLTGELLLLFTPIKALCTTRAGKIPVGTTVFIEAVAQDRENKMFYRITGIWYYYWCFTIN